MSTRTWNQERSRKRIQKKIEDLPIKDIEIKDYVRETDLSTLADHVAYRVDGVHLYADILNLNDMLHVTQIEGETCHRRVLRFLDLQYRAATRILRKEGALRIDFHNQRLHAVVTKPYGDEEGRIHTAIALAQLLIDVLAQTGEDADHPAAQLRIGIDTGTALAVNNGRRGHREPLFLGQPANLAAKRSGGGTEEGIYLTNRARAAIDLASVKNENTSPLSFKEVQSSQDAANLISSADSIVNAWKKDLELNPIGKFEFSGHTPPFATLDLETLAAGNSRRQNAATMYADIDGFTDYVGANISDDESARHVVRALRVLRSELDAVLHEDFKGRKVRFIGDCVHGLVVEGTAQTTDTEATITTTVLCAAGMRSSFGLVLSLLKEAGTDASSLGLQVGLDYGPIATTRLGIKGDLIRCSVSRSTRCAEAEQGRCAGSETAIGEAAYKVATQGVRDLFGDTRKRECLEYSVAVDELAKKRDSIAIAAKSAVAVASLLKTASSPADPYAFRNTPSGPAKPNGFA